jgi:hypothetical protein
VIKKLQIKNQLKEVKLKNGVNIKNQLIEINVNIKFIIFIPFFARAFLHGPLYRFRPRGHAVMALVARPGVDHQLISS